MRVGCCFIRMCASSPRVSGYADPTARADGPGILVAFAWLSTGFQRYWQRRKYYSWKGRKTLTREKAWASLQPLLEQLGHGERISRINCEQNESRSSPTQTMWDAATPRLWPVLFL